MAAAEGPSGDMQVQVRFETKLPERFRIPPSTFAVPASLTRYGLSEVVNTLLGSAEKPQPFDFLVQGSLLRSSLYNCLLSHGLSTESATVVEYVLATAPPEPGPRVAHDDWVSAVCCSPVGGAIVTGSYDAAVRVYAGAPLGLASTPSPGGGGEAWEERDVTEPQLVVSGHTGAVTSVAVYSLGGGEGGAGMLVLSGSKDHHLRLTQVGKRSSGAALEYAVERTAVLSGHVSAVQCCAISSNGEEACSGSWDGEVKIWPLAVGLEAADSAVRGGGGADEAAAAATRASNKKKRRVDASEPLALGPAQVEAQCTLTGHTGAVAALEYVAPLGAEEAEDAATWQPLGQSIVSGSWDHSIQVWDCATRVSTHAMRTTHPVYTVSAYGGDRRSLIASGGASRTLLLWDTRAKGTTGPALKLTSHKSWISSVKWCRDRSYPQLLVSASYDGTLKIWDTRTTVPLHTILAHPKNKVFSVDWWQASAFCSGGSDSKLRLFQHSLH